MSPDEYRDYQIEKRLPELEGELKVIRDELDEVLNTLDTLGVAGSEETVIITMRDQLNEILRDTEKITKMVKAFKTNVSALGTWITNAQQQPLQLEGNGRKRIRGSRRRT